MAEEIVNEESKGGFDIKSLPFGAWVGIAVATLVIGILIGHFVMGGGAGAALNKTKLTESELNTVVANYSYKGKTNQITAKEVIEQNGSLDASKDEEGNFAVPTADTVVTYARNRIISSAADAEGVNVSDEDIAKYAEETLGTKDYASIASSYGMTEDQVKELLKQSAQMNALRDKVVNGGEAGEAPEQPEQPEAKTTDDEGNELDDEGKQQAQDEANKKMEKKYFDYIVKLAGDQWDAKAGKWKAEDSSYATALSTDDLKGQFKKDSASYNAANAAYMVAYQEYSTKQSEISEQWTNYVNGLLGEASIALNTLVA